jgi:putative hydrolase of the HAD superfamily
MIKIILFDIFGTIIDTGKGSLKATEKILKSHNSNIDPHDFYYNNWKPLCKAYYSKKRFYTEKEIFTETLSHTEKKFHLYDNSKKDVKYYLESLTERKLFPHAEKILKELSKKYTLIAASNSDTQPLLVNFDKLNITKYFSKIYTSEDLQTYKPQKEFFEKILKNIKCDQKEVLFIGDTQDEDILGAKRAGLTTVWINRKNEAFKKEIPKSDHEVNDLMELLNFDF